jgi:KaiC/GvpD/RAD55 family RecA-like ATPase
VKRTKTGIPGLDGILNGGFPKNRSILVTGGPGSAKTTFSMQFLCNGAREFNEPGVYVTLGERPRDIIENLSWFDFGIDDLLKEKKIAFIDLSIGVGGNERDVEILRNTLATTVREMGAARIVIDPITAMIIHLETGEIREKLITFSNFSNDLKCTTLLVSEMPVGKHSISVFGVEEFAVDGVIILHHMQRGDVRIRGLEVLKMRGTEHGNRIYPLAFSRRGLGIQPEGRIFEEF